MNDNIQEYYSPVATGKSTRFIPSQMFFNSRSFDEFYLVGLDTQYVEKEYRDFAKKMLGFKYYLGGVRNVKIHHFDLKPYLKEQEHNLDSKLSEFLSRAGRKSNIVIDDTSLIRRYFPGLYDLIDKLSEGVGVITIVSGSGSVLTDIISRGYRHR